MLAPRALHASSLAASRHAVASRLPQVAFRSSWRGLATEAGEPCRSYLKVTHPDNFSSSDSLVNQTLQRFERSTLATYSRPTVLLTRGKGMELFANAESASDPSKLEERRYLDFSSGIAVNSLGHADEQIAEVAAEQARRLVHSSNLYHNEWSGELADRLVQLTRENGGLGMTKGATNEDGTLKVFLANSGTEANEAALKFARKHGMIKAGNKAGAKSGLVSFNNAFHGRTMGALSVTPNPKYQAPFAPLLGNIKTGTYNDASNLHELIDETTAGVIIEPVQGEGGIFPASLDFLKALRKRCDEVGAVLIFDEIQCGLYRGGTLWCHSEFPVEAHPDMVTMAKPLANGFPVGAVLMRQKIADAVVVGDHGTTFGGGPFCSRIAHHVLGRLSDPALVSSMKASSEHLLARLTSIRKMFPDLVRHEEGTAFKSPRGKGLLIGMSMKDPSHAGRIVKLARERGLIVLSAGSDAVRIVPSLIVSKRDVDEACDILESSFLVLRDEVAAAGKSA